MQINPNKIFRKIDKKIRLNSATTPVDSTKSPLTPTNPESGTREIPRSLFHVRSEVPKKANSKLTPFFRT